MADLKDIILNIEQLYGSNNSLSMLKDFERVLDELDIYVFDNWIDGEIVAGPKESRYFVECTLMWAEDKMPEPRGGLRLLDYGCKVQFAKSVLNKVRKIKNPDDIRPGTRKGKIDQEPIYLAKIIMPKKLMSDIQRGYNNLDSNKVEDIISQEDIMGSNPAGSAQQVQDVQNAE
jgi:hypothetical protein